MAVLFGKTCLRAAALLIALGASLGAQADTTLTYQDQNDNGAQAFIISIQPPFLRMDEAGGMWMLYNGQTDTLYAVQPSEKSYTKMDRATARQLGGALSAVEEQMKKLPPEQRAAIEQMMGRSMPSSKKKPKVEYLMTNNTRKRAGVQCRVGHLVQADKTRHEFCVAKPDALGMPAADYEVMTKMFALMSEFRDAAGSMLDQELPDPSELKGVAVESNGPEGGHHVLSRFNNDKLSAENFKLPPDYRQEAMPSMVP